MAIHVTFVVRALLLIIPFVFSLLPVSSLAGTIATGDRIRIKYDPGHKVTGTVVSLDNQNIVIGPENASENTTVETGAVRSVERFEGEHSNWDVGMFIGGIAGLAVGAIAASSNDDDSFAEPSSDLAYLLVTPAAGAALGALVGSFIKSDKWVSVPLSGLGVGTIPGDAHGVELSWSVRF